MLEIFEALTQSIQDRKPVALATITEVKGASPARPGFKLLVWEDGSCVGNVGGGELEVRIRDAARKTLAEHKAQTLKYTLRESGPDAIDTLCGGNVTVFIEPYLPQPVLLIVGGGHIGRPLAELARIVGDEVQTVDTRPERADLPRLDPTKITAHSYVVLITETHESDEQALGAVLPTPAAYIGMIGSRRKIETIMKHLRAAGFADDALARVHAPIGLDTGGRAPEEIALAILAEIECVRHGGSGVPRSGIPLPAGSHSPTTRSKSL